MERERNRAIVGQIYGIRVLPEKACPECGERRLALLQFDMQDNLVRCRWCASEFARVSERSEEANPAA
jgi:DNA-directed RNA polymerase subunit RPC12/RpoP